MIVVTTRPRFNGSRLAAGCPLLARYGVRGAGIVRINQLSTGMADPDGCRGDNKAPRHGDGRHGANNHSFAQRHDQNGRQEREADSPDELFGIFLVSFDRRVRNEMFDLVLLTLTGIHGDEPSAEQQCLKRDDRHPCAARPSSIRPQRPGESTRQSRNYERQAQRHVHQGGMERQGCHGVLLSMCVSRRV
jgi:hypothetical protein